MGNKNSSHTPTPTLIPNPNEFEKDKLKELGFIFGSKKGEMINVQFPLGYGLFVKTNVFNKHEYTFESYILDKRGKPVAHISKSCIPNLVDKEDYTFRLLDTNKRYDMTQLNWRDGYYESNNNECNDNYDDLRI